MEFRPSKRHLRLASGLVLFTYITAHFVNHALGLVSMAVAERGLRIAIAVWQSLPGTLLLYGAAGIHIGLAFMAIHQHRTLRLPALEWMRLLAGFGMPALLIGHAVDTRLALQVTGRPTDYAHVVWTLWHSGREGRQIALLVPGWLHVCLGLRIAFGSRAWYRRWRMAAFGAALVLPLLAVLGFVSMLKEVAVLAHDPSWAATVTGPIGDARRLRLDFVREGLLWSYFGAIAAVFAARLVRTLLEERRGSLVSIGYPGRSVRVPRGWSVLDASRAHRIAHTSMCGGRARCSTCRVRVIAGLENCPPPAGDELATLARIHAPEGTRLACQLRPRADVEVVPLVAAAVRIDSHRAAEERELAVVLVDVHWFEAPRRLMPHDLLHALDCFGAIVGDAVRAGGGVPIPFQDDRAMGLFGLDAPPAEANRRALQAATRLDARLHDLRQRLRAEFCCDLRHVICVHFGPAVVGEIGDPAARTLMAAGGAIDIVRRLAAGAGASLPGEEGCAGIVVSRAAFAAARPDAPELPWDEMRLVDGRRIEFARLS